MIIGEALRRLFNGMTIDLTIDGNTVCRPIQFHYGDHKELTKWILDKNKGNSKKYPLLWYVTAPYVEESTDYKNVKSKLIIFQSTQIDWMNTKRSVKSYDQIIEPVWQKVKKIISSSKYIQVMGELSSKYLIKDEPSYGVNTDDIRLSQTDFTNKNKKGTESISLDVVDGRIIEINLRIKTNCI
tara:strand:- start:33 stop:584 length:552 start_codon:yes stop_codon:yes gene_type:complete